MFRFFVIAVCVFGLVSTGVPKQQLKIIVPEQQPEASHDIGSVHELSGHESSSYGGEFGGHFNSDDEPGHIGAELISLAHSSAIRAKNAVQNQLSAGSQAAFGAATSLASTALGAARTAQAALIGKQALIQNLKKELIEAEHRFQGEIANYQQAEAAAEAAHQAAQQAQDQVDSITGILSAAQMGAQHAEQASAAAANIAAAQHSMAVDAKQQVAHILSEIQSVLEELHETEFSAQTAAESAQTAQSNAAAAAASVQAASIKGPFSGGHHY